MKKALPSALAVGSLCALALAVGTLGATVESKERMVPSALSQQRLQDGKVPAEYRQWIVRAGEVCPEISAPVVAAQIEAESGWRPDAVSPVGARGLSQFMPATWNTWGVDADASGAADPFSPADAIMTQARYDCWLVDEVRRLDVPGDIVRLALAAYNAGPGAVRRYGGIPPYQETQAYVARITALTAQYVTIATDDAEASDNAVVAQAMRWLGTPYAWGGGDVNGPTEGFAQGAGTIGFDCSSLVQHAVYQATGGRTVLPRVSQQQALAGESVDRAGIRPGDLVAFQLSGAGWDHIGIYLGDGQFVHAPRTGDVVKVSSLDETYYASRPLTIRRVV